MMSSTTGSTTHRDATGSTKKDDKTREDRAAEAVPDDATSMSVGPPSEDARRSSEEVGEPQANPAHQGPSPPNKRAKGVSAPPVGPPAASERTEDRPEHRLPGKDGKGYPSRETLKGLGADEEE